MICETLGNFGEKMSDRLSSTDFSYKYFGEKMMLFLYFSPNFFPELFLSVFMYNLEVKNRVDFGEKGKKKKNIYLRFFFQENGQKGEKMGR